MATSTKNCIHPGWGRPSTPSRKTDRWDQPSQSRPLPINKRQPSGPKLFECDVEGLSDANWDEIEAWVRSHAINKHSNYLLYVSLANDPTNPSRPLQLRWKAGCQQLNQNQRQRVNAMVQRRALQSDVGVLKIVVK